MDEQLFNNNKESIQNEEKMDNQSSNSIQTENLNTNQLLEIILNSNRSLSKKLDEELESIKTKLNKVQSNTVNQNSISIQTNQTESNKDLNFKLSFHLRNKLIVSFNDFSYLLYADIDQIREKFIYKINNLIYNLVDLPLKLDIDQNDEINSTDENQIRPTLILGSKLKTEITDLLVKNKNYSIVLKDKISKDNKLNLIKENNQIIFKLQNLNIEMEKLDDPIDDVFIFNEPSIVSKSNDFIFSTNIPLVSNPFTSSTCNTIFPSITTTSISTTTNSTSTIFPPATSSIPTTSIATSLFTSNSSNINGLHFPCSGLNSCLTSNFSPKTITFGKRE